MQVKRILVESMSILGWKETLAVFYVDIEVFDILK